MTRLNRKNTSESRLLKWLASHITDILCRTTTTKPRSQKTVKTSQNIDLQSACKVEKRLHKIKLWTSTKIENAIIWRENWRIIIRGSHRNGNWIEKFACQRLSESVFNIGAQNNRKCFSVSWLVMMKRSINFEDFRQKIQSDFVVENRFPFPSTKSQFFARFHERKSPISLFKAEQMRILHEQSLHGTTPKPFHHCKWNLCCLLHHP